MAKKKSGKPNQRQSARGANNAASSAPVKKHFPPVNGKQRSLVEDPVKENKHSSRLERPFQVVGIGASAGGFEAFKSLLEHLPAENNMAFVLITHLAPTHDSMLSELLSRNLRMPVQEIKDGTLVAPAHIYVIPPNVTTVISGRKLRLFPRKTQEQHMPIDCFLRSLAQEYGDKAVGIILSGTGSDGALGIAAVKEAGGLTFSQDERSAKFNSMPHNAIATGCIDFILPVEKIAEELVRIPHHPYLRQPRSLKADEMFPGEEDDLRRILTTLRLSTGLDFTSYKQSTIKRRISRRMALHRMDTLAQYFKFIQDRPDEASQLHNELLIAVTNFFRDGRAFDLLKKKVFPVLVRNRPADEPIRIWVPGCSTGEEVYSIAICLLEFLSEKNLHLPVQMFATDVSESALRKARIGKYIENIVQDVSRERIRRFFIKSEQGYEVSKTIRDMCIFARQDLSKDPPFSRMDLISCRNVLIYMGQGLQKKVIPTLHYALKPRGFLLLGASETIGAYSDLFAMIDKKYKIYARKAIPTRMQLSFTAGPHQPEEVIRMDLAPQTDDTAKNELDLQREADRILLNHYAPAGVLVNEGMEIIQFRGDVSPFLTPSSGKASFNLLKMAREGLLVELRKALNQARRSNIVVHSNQISLRAYNEIRKVTLKIVPLKHPRGHSTHYLVLFDAVPAPTERMTRTSAAKSGKTVGARQELEQLKVELISTREYLQSIIEEQEATNEELKSANEEILSSNEELQSTNEELETAKEELQSTNEELQTVNEEVQNRNTDLGQLNNDLTNLLSTINLPIVMLGHDLRVRRFTPMAEKLMNLINSDVGRPISDINTNVAIADLDELVTSVIDNVSVEEREVQDKDGHWYLLRIRPYKTPENKIDGAVLVFINLDELKRSTHQLREFQDSVATVMEIAQNPLLVVDNKLMVRRSNTAFQKMFGISVQEATQRPLNEVWRKAWEIPELQNAFETLVRKGKNIVNLDIKYRISRTQESTYIINTRPIRVEPHQEDLILLSIEDTSAFSHSQDQNIMLMQEIHHRVKNNLQIVSSLLNLQSGYTKDPQIVKILAESRHRVRSMALIHEKLYQSKEINTIEFSDYVRSLATYLLTSYDVKRDGIELDVDVDKSYLDIDTAIPCGLIINELFSNALKHAFPDNGKDKWTSRKITLAVHSEDSGRTTITVADSGIGLPKGVEIEKTQSLGLRLVRTLVEQIDGNIEIRVNGGTEWKITFSPPPPRRLPA